MSGDITNEILEKHMKKWALKANALAVVVAVFTAASIGYGFYYNTKSDLRQNKSDITEIKDDVDEIKKTVTDNVVYKGTSTVEMKSMKESIDRIENNQDKMMEMMTTYFAKRSD
jgi:Tfp pilus assembly protein PilO